LIELGANPDLEDLYGWTPHGIAKACGHDSIATFLRLKQKKLSNSVLAPGMPTKITDDSQVVYM
jgi:ankyrin repeat protein